MEKTNNVTLEAVKLACEMIFEKEFNMKLEIPVLLTGRLKKSLGRFYYNSALHKPSKLVFNKSFFTNPAYDLATLESVLLHECVHAELCIKGMPFDDCDSTFIKECKRSRAHLKSRMVWKTSKSCSMQPKSKLILTAIKFPQTNCQTR